MLELLEIFLAYRRLTDPKVRVGPVVLDWPELGETDDELTLKWVTFLRQIGALTLKTALQLSGRVENPDDELAAAEEEAAEAMDAFEADLDGAIEDALNREGGGQTGSPAQRAPVDAGAED